jgi:hypothetical protein
MCGAPPKRILNAHPSDQRPQIRIDLRPASQMVGVPIPIIILLWFFMH